MRRRARAVGGPHAGSGPDRHHLFADPRQISDGRRPLYYNRRFVWIGDGSWPGTVLWDFIKGRRRQDHHGTDNAGGQPGGYDEATPGLPSGPSIIGPTVAPREASRV